MATVVEEIDSSPLRAISISVIKNDHHHLGTESPPDRGLLCLSQRSVEYSLKRAMKLQTAKWCQRLNVPTVAGTLKGL